MIEVEPRVDPDAEVKAVISHEAQIPRLRERRIEALSHGAIVSAAQWGERERILKEVTAREEAALIERGVIWERPE